MLLHIIELLTALDKYARTALPSVVNYKKNPIHPDDVPFEEKLLFVADFPALTTLSDLRNNDKYLSVVINAMDTGEMLQASEYGRRGNIRRVSIGVNIWTADPILREYVSSEFYEFLTKNPHLIQGTHTPWQVDVIQSGGYRAAATGLHRRAFTVWLREFHTF